MNAIAPSTSAATSAVLSNGPGGVLAPAPAAGDERAKLTAMLRAGGPVLAPVTPVEPPPSAAPAEPETPPATAAEEASGQTLTAEQTPPSPDAQTQETPGEGNEPPSNPSVEGEEPKAANTPEWSKAAQKRIDALTAEKYQLRGRTVELEGRVKELEAKLDAAPAPVASAASAPLPETVTKLKTVQAVEARQVQVESDIDELTAFLRLRSGDPETVYDAATGQAVQADPDGARYVSRQQIVHRLKQLETEARALPKQARAIADHAERAAERNRLREATHAKLPQLADAESADAKAVNAMLKTNPWLDSFANPELEALIRLRGLAALDAELAARNGNGKGNGHGKPPSPFAKAPARTTTPAAAPAAIVPPLKTATKQEALDRGSFLAVLGRKPQ